LEHLEVLVDAPLKSREKEELPLSFHSALFSSSLSTLWLSTWEFRDLAPFPFHMV